MDTWLPIHDWTEAQVWQRIRESGVPYHPAYEKGMTRLSCSLCVLGSRADLVRAAQLRPDLAAEYAAVEVEISHRFRNDMSMSDIIAAAAASSPATPKDIEHAEIINLGHGVLSWPRFERQTDRYGTVVLCTGPSGEGNVSFASAPVGSRRHLLAIVLATRPSVHCGDITHGLAPSIPAVGEVIVLGSGTVFTDANPDTGLPTAVGLRPDDGRDENWLDPRALYRCHNQTVRLELRAARHTDHRQANARRVV